MRVELSSKIQDQTYYKSNSDSVISLKPSGTSKAISSRFFFLDYNEILFQIEEDLKIPIEFTPKQNTQNLKELKFTQYDEDLVLIDDYRIYEHVYYLGFYRGIENSDKYYKCVRAAVTEGKINLIIADTEVGSLFYYSPEFYERQGWAAFIHHLIHDKDIYTLYNNEFIELTTKEIFKNIFDVVFNKVDNEIKKGKNTSASGE